MANEPGLSGWRRRLVAWGLGVKASAVPQKISLSLLNPQGWDLIAGSSSSGKQVNDDSALRVSAVWACNKVLSESIGSLPLAMYERDKAGNSVKVEGHRVAELLTVSPNVDMTAQEYLEAGQLNLGLRGNGYSLIDRASRGEISSLYPIVSSLVVPERTEEGVVQYKVNDRGRWETFPREKIWHVKGFGGNGLVGLSVLAAAREAMGLALSAEEFQGKFFLNGARPSAIATFPGWFKDEQRKIARENVNSLLGGLDNAHKVHILEGGMTLTDWGMPLQDAQFLELRQFSITDICRFYRVPPHMVADLSRATFSNIEQQSLEFVQYTLMPWLTRWEKSAQRWLLNQTDRKRFFFRFNVDVLLRADSKTRGEFLSLMVQNGIMTRNEARAKENLGAAPELDEFTAQVNLTTVEKLGEDKAPPAPPAAVVEEAEKARSEVYTKQSDLFLRGLDGLARAVANQRPGDTYVTLPEIKFPEQKPTIVNVTTPEVKVESPITIAEGAIQINQSKAPVRRIPVRGADGLIQHTDEIPLDDVANG